MSNSNKKDINDHIFDGEKHSNLEIIQCSLIRIILTVSDLSIAAWVLKFFETVVLLPIWMILIGFCIYNGLNAISDFLIGYYSAQETRIFKKWGKRFPWLIFSIFPCLLFYFALFTPPNIDNSMIIFLWYTFNLIGFYVFWNSATINLDILSKDKFRSESDRKKLGFMININALLAIFIGSIFQPLILNFYGENRMGYSYMIGFGCIGAIIVIFISIPGIREDKGTINRYIRDFEKNETTVEFFSSQVKNQVLKHRNFLILMIITVGDIVREYLLITSIPYFIVYILEEPIITFSFLVLPYFLGNAIGVPIYGLLSKKYDHLKLSKIFRFINIFTYLPMWFSFNVYSVAIVLFINGIFLGGLTISNSEIYDIMYDEAAFMSGKRQNGLYIQIQQFVNKSGVFIFIIIFGVVHIVSEFNPLYHNDQLYSALIGIKLLIIVFPSIIAAISTLVLMKGFKMTPEKWNEIQSKLKELNL